MDYAAIQIHVDLWKQGHLERPTFCKYLYPERKRFLHTKCKFPCLVLLNPIRVFHLLCHNQFRWVTFCKNPKIIWARNQIDITYIELYKQRFVKFYKSALKIVSLLCISWGIFDKNNNNHTIILQWLYNYSFMINENLLCVEKVLIFTLQDLIFFEIAINSFK